METLHNQELVATILEDNVASELTTIQDFLRWTYSTFNRSDIYYGQGHDNAWDESLQLVLAGLQLPIDLPQDLFNSKLTHSEKETLVQLVLSRIEQRVPVAYLTNSAWFCGLEFYVDERTIIPRSPISALIQDKFAPLLKSEPKRILDLCTGSGCIAIATAEAFPEAEVDAVDLSVDALNVAEINIARHQLEHRVFPIQSDLFQNLFGQQYDLIVTNPPYVDEEDLDPVFMWHLAHAYGEEERDTEAQHFYELAYPTLKSQSLFLSDYYFYLIEIGQKDKAKVLLNELLIIDPTNETWNEELSRLND